jgi:hypothetical protein
MRLIDTLKKRSRHPRPLRPQPFFAMLERRGVGYAELENAIGAEALPRAMRRCAECNARYYCGRRGAACPNGPLFTAALRKRAAAA